MFVSVYLFVPETKGKTLEAMDEIFGSAYANRDETIDLELGRYQNQVRDGREGASKCAKESAEVTFSEGRDVDQGTPKDALAINFVGKAVN